MERPYNFNLFLKKCAILKHRDLLFVIKDIPLLPT